MTSAPDPFELLPRIVDPEPDPAVMRAVIAQSRDAFANRGRSRKSRKRSLSGWLGQSANWLMPVGVGVAALAVVLVVAPGLLQTGPVPAPSRDVVADQPTVRLPNSPTLSRGDEAQDAEPSPGTRMGMQPVPGAVPAPTEVLPQTVSRFEGENVVIGTRLDATGLELFLPEISGDETIDVQGIMPGEEIDILDAFAEPDRDLIAVRFGVGDVQFWRVYRLTDGRYVRDTERSQMVSNAVDRAEVERRLDGQ